MSIQQPEIFKESNRTRPQHKINLPSILYEDRYISAHLNNAVRAWSRGVIRTTELCLPRFSTFYLSLVFYYKVKLAKLFDWRCVEALLTMILPLFGGTVGQGLWHSG